MIQFIVGGVVGVVGSAAAAGATYRMASGVVRGAGRLLEGDPKQALGEVVGGVVDPLAIAGAQMVGLVGNTMDVTAYGLTRVASLVSDDAARLVKQSSGIDGFMSAALGAVMLGGMAKAAAERQAEHEAAVNRTAAQPQAA